MCTLTLIRGLPGSGKSTLADTLCDNDEYCSWWEEDMWLPNGGLYDEVSQEDRDFALGECLSLVKDSLSLGQNVYVSNTFARICEMMPYIHTAKKFGAKIVVLHCESNFGNVHNVPETAIDRMRNRWEDYSDKETVSA